MQPDDETVWWCRGYAFRRHGAYVILEGAGTPPVLGPQMLRELAATLTEAADTLEGKG